MCGGQAVNENISFKDISTGVSSILFIVFFGLLPIEGDGGRRHDARYVCDGASGDRLVRLKDGVAVTESHACDDVKRMCVGCIVSRSLS